ncbi:transcriptional regulator, TetR family [Paenibacillus sp. UNCCL117]|uniref:TetR/AcrR family transcriptional regulator n=1 Tax=unclassified Paenibacillus TaxID=185978 RepID=UPI0008849718|nr:MULTISPECIES: TetR/AcrR family transcriptional regulator [unclassified Paenibacillus]SDE37369.1 DNA-binding transcriptional regulator, AcrR family [Paenibacillus sp. cl123]SFW64931.1 transcriptional regulator, TetR family [Paenibacillus sp. UNCCL117]
MTSDRIKEAALQLFTRSGYDGVPLSEIAGAVGIKTPSIYAHYKSKDELFMAVLEDCLGEHNRRMEQLIGSLEGRSVADKLRTILEDARHSYLLGDEQVTFLKRAMLFPPSSLEDRLRDQFSGYEQALHAALGAMFEEGIQAGQLSPQPIDELIASFYCVMDGLFLQQFYYRQDDSKARMQAVWSIFWKGICK